MAEGDGETTLRLRAAASRWFSALVVALVVLAAVGAGLTYATHVDPGETTETVTRTVVPVDGSVSHSAAVTRPNPVYPVGTTLEGQSTYFTGVSPVLNVTYALTYGGAAETADVAVNAAVVTRSSPEGSDATLWTERRPLGAERATDVPPGESVTTSVELNASALRDRIARIRSELGASPGTVSSRVVFDVTVTAVVDGEEVALSYVATLPITPGAETYAVEEATGVSDAVEETETVVRERSYGPLRTFGAPAVGALALAGLGGLGVARRRGALALTEGERAYLAYRDDRETFDEWITEIRLPEAALDRPEAEASSLADLVDFAIDADAPVITSPDGDAYQVLADDLRYVYRPPTLDEDDGFETPEVVGAPEGGGDSVDDADGGAGRDDGEAVGVDDADRENGAGRGDSADRENGADRESDDGAAASDGSDDGTDPERGGPEPGARSDGDDGSRGN